MKKKIIVTKLLPCKTIVNRSKKKKIRFIVYALFWGVRYPKII